MWGCFPGFFSSGPKVIIDGKEHQAGFTGYSISKSMQRNDEAYKFALKYQSYQKWAARACLLISPVRPP